MIHWVERRLRSAKDESYREPMRYAALRFTQPNVQEIVHEG